jgi:DNA invertase Pin-like site-specific DNA recombinase
MNSDQISPAQQARLAYIYIRQSSMQQVRHHTESQHRQRQLVGRAMALGWPEVQVVIIDEDLGQSAACTGQRSGFERLIAEVAVGRVGVILSLEASRISRANRSWYHLLDICAVTNTLIGDGEALYDPCAYNDRLLLGLKGTMSEAELYVMKQRLVAAVRSKAERGEFRFSLPPGYYWDEAGRIQKSPDQQIRTTIELIFARFEQFGTINTAFVSLAEEGIELPVRDGGGDRIRWQQASYEAVRRMLKNPVYAGAYVYGRRQVEAYVDADQQPLKRIREQPDSNWHVLIKDHHEGYISWETFERNQGRIESNRRSESTGGAPREGTSLLQGLVLCARCGRPMKVNYIRSRHARFVCTQQPRQGTAPVCQAFGATRLEQAFEQLILEALAPFGMEAMLGAETAHQQAGDAQRSLWQQRLERARYEADLARRQYEAVDPANRLVAGELERRWEQALGALDEIEREVEAKQQTLEQPLSADEKARLRQFAEDLPSLWQAPTTRAQDRKRLIRCLVEQVVVRVPQDDAPLQAQIHWFGGEVTPITVPKGRIGVHRYATDPEIVDLVRRLAEEFSDEQIARILHRKGIKTSKGLAFTAHRVTNLRGRHKIPGRTRAKLQEEHIHTVEQAAERLHISRCTVVHWIELGLLKATQITPGAPWRVELTDEDYRRLTAGDAPAGWLTLKAAAQALGVSQQTVLKKLNVGELEGVRVQAGARTAWRIRVDSTCYDGQQDLFD